MYRNDEDGAIDEEYKSEDEMRRVLSETSEEEEGSNAGSPTIMRRVKRNKAKASHPRTGDRLRELGHARKRYGDDSMSSASEFSDSQANSDKDRDEGEEVLHLWGSRVRSQNVPEAKRDGKGIDCQRRSVASLVRLRR